MKTYIVLVENVALDDKGTIETRYYAYNAVSKHRHSEWKSYTDAVKAVRDLNGFVAQARAYETDNEDMWR